MFALEFLPALRMLRRAVGADRRRLSARRDRHRAGRVSARGQRQPDRRRTARRVGSELIGQPFDDPKYFWSRPSATSPQPYNGAASSGSNQGPRNPALADAVKDRIKALRDADPGQHGRRCRSISSRRRAAASIRTSASRPRTTRSRASPRRAACPPKRVRALRRPDDRGPHVRRAGRAARQRARAQPRARSRA